MWSLTLSDDAPLLIDESIQQLFVEYKFLSYDAAELETPFSLPKKSAGHTMSYNFKKGAVRKCVETVSETYGCVVGSGRQAVKEKQMIMEDR